MVAAIAPKDVGIGMGYVVFVLLWFGFRAVGHLTNMVIWSVAGVLSFCWAFTVTGRLKLRKEVKDNVRLAADVSRTMYQWAFLKF